MQPDSIVHLLWTGGWDSTFRLLQLLEQGVTVQPHYLVEAERRSTKVELLTMQKIRAAIGTRYPQWAARLLPLRITAVDDIPENQAITDTYWRMRERVYVGSQYEWMARYCAQSGIEWFDFGYNSSGPGGSRRLRQYYAKAADGDYYIIDPQYKHLDEYELFRWYHFSLGETTKVEMQEMAAKAGYLDILCKSWFCHKPQPDLTPCGTCSPCTSLMEEGMRWRIPWKARIRYYMPGRAMLQRYVMGNKRLYRFANRILYKPVEQAEDEEAGQTGQVSPAD